MYTHTHSHTHAHTHARTHATHSHIQTHTRDGALQQCPRVTQNEMYGKEGASCHWPPAGCPNLFAVYYAVADAERDPASPPAYEDVREGVEVSVHSDYV